MKVEALSVLKGQVPAAKKFIVVGTDEAYVSYCTSVLKSQMGTGFSVKTLPQQVVLETPHEVFSTQLDLFSDSASKALVVVLGATDKILPVLKTHTDSGDPLILAGESYAQTKKLQKLFADTPDHVLVSAFLNGPQDYSLFLDRLSEDCNLSLSKEAREKLIHLMREGLIDVIQEMEKLALYGGGHVTLEDVENSCAPHDEGQIAELAEALCLKSFDKTIQNYDRLKKGGAEDIFILRALTNHFSKFLDLKGFVEQGMPLSRAFMMTAPPIFQKQQPLYQKTFERWSEGDIRKLLGHLQAGEVRIKRAHPAGGENLWHTLHNIVKEVDVK